MVFFAYLKLVCPWITHDEVSRFVLWRLIDLVISQEHFYLWNRDMATLGDIGVAATINILSAFAFLLAFAILRIQPVNDRVYFPKWYLKGLRSNPLHTGAFVSKFVNLDFRSYLRFLSWMPAALQMPEPELIDHAGLDSAVYLRIYLIGYALVYIFWRGVEYSICSNSRISVRAVVKKYVGHDHFLTRD